MFLALGWIGASALADLAFDLLVERRHLAFEEPVDRQENHVTDGKEEDQKADQAQNAFGQERAHGHDDEQRDEQAFDLTQFTPDGDEFSTVDW